MKNIEQLATKFRKAIDMALEAGEFAGDRHISQISTCLLRRYE